MTASPFTPAHGSALRSLKPCREHVTVRICVGSGRAHRYLIGFNRPNALNLARIQSAANLPGRGNWDRTIERTHTLSLWPGPSFSSFSAGYAMSAGPNLPPACFFAFARSSIFAKSRRAASSKLSVSRQSFRLRCCSMTKQEHGVTSMGRRETKHYVQQEKK